MAYSVALPTDSAAKKFVAVLVDNAATNEFDAIKGVNRTTQNAEIVADMSVASTAEGGTADAAIVTDTTGSVSGKLRGLVKFAYERMPASLGTKAQAASLPVTLASDEPHIKAEDTAHTTGDKGVMALAVRADTAAATAGTTGDYIPLTTDATGRLWVHDTNIDALATTQLASQAAIATAGSENFSTDLRQYTALSFALDVDVTSVPDGSTLIVGIIFRDAKDDLEYRIRFLDVTAADIKQTAVLLPGGAPVQRVYLSVAAVASLMQGQVIDGPVSDDGRVGWSVTGAGGTTAWVFTVHVIGKR